MTYVLKEQQKEAIRVLKYDCRLKTHEIIERFAIEQYPITEAQVKNISNIPMKNKEFAHVKFY